MEAVATRSVLSRNLEPISLNELRTTVPSVFADRAHEDCSSRYGFASTAKVLTSLEKAGFVVVEAKDNLRRNPGNLEFTKHMLRLRKAGDVKKITEVGDVVPQVVLINSHDRSSLFQMYAGMFRLVCSNGLIVSTKEFIEPIVVRHTNRVVEDVMANIDRIVGDVGRVTDIIGEMSKTKLSEKQQLAFAEGALEFRFGNGNGRGSIDPAALLVPRRTEDNRADVWHVYNRVQENMMKGGIASTTAAGRNTMTKPITAVNSDLHINTGLWELAMATIAKARESSKGKKVAKKAE
jgi:hypothetical protein